MIPKKTERTTEKERALLKKVKEYCDTYDLIKPQDHILLGLSGGIDSVCLLEVLCKLQPIYQLTITAVHIEHGIRGQDALRDMEFVKELCGRKQIACICESYDVKELAKRQGLGYEETGRAVRYEAFQRLAAQVGAHKIAVAHHGNDLAETMLFFLSRGTALAGLAPIQPKRGNIIRPLLAVTRKEIEEYVQDKKLSYCVDDTNEDIAYSRNLIRHQIIPILESLNPQSVEHFVQTGHMMIDILGMVKDTAEYAKSMVVTNGDHILLTTELFTTQRDVVIHEVIMQAIERQSDSRKNITRAHLQAVQDLMHSQVGRHVDLPYGLHAMREYGGVAIVKDICTQDHVPQDKIYPLHAGQYVLPNGQTVQLTELHGSQADAEIPTKKYTKWFDYDIIQDNLCLRQHMPKDYMVISKDGTRKQVKKIFVDDKIPRQDRQKLYVLASDNEVYWILGHRMSERAKITASTKRVLEITLYEGDKTHE